MKTTYLKLDFEMFETKLEENCENCNLNIRGYCKVDFEKINKLKRCEEYENDTKIK
jgi:hypothetical protein